MCHQKRPPSIMELSLTQLEHGQIKEKSNSLRRTVDIDDILSKIKMISKMNAGELFIAELVAESKRKISNDKLNFFENIIRITKLLQTSEVESTSRDPDSFESWRNYSTEISKKLSLHTEIDSHGSDLSSLNGYFKSLNQRLQRLIKKVNPKKKNCRKISWKSLPYSLPGLTTNIHTRTMKIKLELTDEQKEWINYWMHLYRALYNLESNEVYNSEEYKKGKILSANTIRDKTLCLRKYVSEIKTEKQRVKIDIINKNLPSAILDCVHQHVKGNYESSKSNRHKDHKKPVMKKKDNTSIMKITYRGYSLGDNTISILPRVTNLSTKCIKVSARYLNNFEEIKKHNSDESHTLTIIRENKNYYAAFVVNKVEVPNISDKFMAFDPGLRTFITTCDSHGNIHEYGNEIVKLATKTAKRIMDRPAKNCNQKRAINRLKSKTDRRISDMHKKLAKYLAINHRAIIAPEIGNSLAHNNTTGKLNSIIQRYVRHAHFSARLRDACPLYGSVYLSCKEYNTTKCCSQCSTGKYEVGKSKVYNCPNGCVSIDRDVNAARNIFSRFLVLYQKNID